jgi:hypothetical protein
MSLYSLNKDMLIKIISDIHNLKNYPTKEILKIKSNCILELSKKTEVLSTTRLKNKKNKLTKGLKHFYRILRDLEDTERLHINFTIHDIKDNKTDHLILSIINNGEYIFQRLHYDAYLCLDFQQYRICLTTSLNHFNHKFTSVVLATEIVIFYSDNQIYAEMEKH